MHMLLVVLEDQDIGEKLSTCSTLKLVSNGFFFCTLIFPLIPLPVFNVLDHQLEAKVLQQSSCSIPPRTQDNTRR